jgi:hypothetical protein
MEEILLNIDSRYRDITKYPNECKFVLNLEKNYKNIISARMVSNEINNNIKYIDSKKNNNFIIVHIPNKLNDPEGTIVELSDGFLQVIQPIQNIFNSLFAFLYNFNGSLEQTIVDDKPFAEKNFYIFYLNKDITLNFDFNNEQNPISLTNKLTIKQGWHTVYGINLQISNYIKEKYNERIIYIKSNSGNAIDLDLGKFKLAPFNLEIFDRRFRNIDFINQRPNSLDCIRIDNFIPLGNDNAGSYTGNLVQNLNLLKSNIYKFYIYDNNSFLITSGIPVANMGILDKLVNNEYIIPIGNGYLNEGTKLMSGSKYYINNSPSTPTSNSTQVYNLQMVVDYTSLKVSFQNSFTQVTTGDGLNFYYYWVDPTKVKPNTWGNADPSDPLGKTFFNMFEYLLDKTYLREQYFISEDQYSNKSFQPSLIKDIAQFQINFSNKELKNPVVNGIMDIKRLNYPSIGYYLGFRPNLKIDKDNFLFTPIIDETDLIINGTKVFDTTGDDYIFLKINNWGYIDFFNQQYFAKIIMTTSLGNPQLNDYVNKEYRFRQPVNINKLEIELVDYLGNTLDMNGSDYSFTLELKQLQNSDQKESYERNNLVFQGYPRNY